MNKRRVEFIAEIVLAAIVGGVVGLTVTLTFKTTPTWAIFLIAVVTDVILSKSIIKLAKKIANLWV